MTEIQFLISLMLEHKLPEAVKQKLIARIGEVEALLQRPGYMSAVTPALIKTSPYAQAPSMQKILDQEPLVSPVAPYVPPRQVTPTEVVTSKGNGGFTKGPRKF